MKYSLSILAILLPLLSFAQSNYKQGYVITNSRDTIKGFINYKERNNNPSSISIKTASSAEPKIYTLGTAAAYEIIGVEKYERYVVNVSQHSVDVSSLSIGIDSTVKIDTVFLRVVEKGANVGLFTYRDNIKVRYYIQDGDGSIPYELSRQMYLDTVGERNIITGNRFLGQMLALLEKYNVPGIDHVQYARQLTYDQSSFEKAVSLINRQTVARKKLKIIRFFAGAGLSSTTMRYSGITDFNNGREQTKATFSPILDFGIDVFANPAIGRFIYRVEVTLSTNKNSISTTTAKQPGLEMRHSFNQSLATLTQHIIYNFYNTDNFKVFGGIGLGLNLAKYTKNDLTTIKSDNTLGVFNNAVQLESFYFSFPVRAGVVLHKKYELFAGYTVPSVISAYRLYNVVLNKSCVGFTYLFGK